MIDQGAAIDPDIVGKRVLILGGGLWHREYALRARRLGAEVWVTDWSTEAPARDAADHFLPIDLRDHAATLALAREAHVEAVFSPADIGVPTAAYVAESMGLPGVGPDAAERATNKYIMRRHAEAAGLRSPWYDKVTSVDGSHAALAGRSFPVIVKPVDSCSSRGVHVVQSAVALDQAVAEALTASLTGAAIIEEFIPGREGSVEAFVQRGQLTVLGVCEKTKSPLPDRFDLELRYPGAYTPTVIRRIAEFTQALVRAFDVHDAMLHIEFLVAEPAEDVVLIEFALRGCGSKVITHLLPALTGIDVVHAIVRQALGLTTPVVRTKSLHGVLHFLLFSPGVVRRVVGVERARTLPGVIDLTVECGPGDRIDRVRDGRSRPGHLLAFATDAAGVQSIVRDVRDLVRVEYDEP